MGADARGWCLPSLAGTFYSRRVGTFTYSRSPDRGFGGSLKPVGSRRRRDGLADPDHLGDDQSAIT